MYHCGLILEGGGMRGIFTAGVLDYFMDQEILFSDVYAVSAGSCHACSYLSNQRRRAFDIGVNYLDDKRYCSIESLIRTGDLFGADMLYREIPDVLNPFDHDAYARYPGRFYAVVTDCETGKPHYKRILDLHEDIIYIRASSSLPAVSRMVEADGHRYLDGGISDSIPIRQAVSDGLSKNVIILTQPADYRKSPNKMVPLLKLLYHQYPELVRTIRDRHLTYNETLAYIEEEEKKGSLFVIRPDGPAGIGRIEKDRKKLEHLYRRGYNTARKQHDALMQFLSE